MPLKCFPIKFNFFHMWPSPSPSILFYDSIVLKSDKNSINKLIFNAPVENFQLSIWTQWVQCRVTEAIRLRSVSTSLLGGKFQSLTNLIRVERRKKFYLPWQNEKGVKNSNDLNKKWSCQWERWEGLSILIVGRFKIFIFERQEDGCEFINFHMSITWHKLLTKTVLIIFHRLFFLPCECANLCLLIIVVFSGWCTLR